MDRFFAYITFTIVLSSVLTLLMHPLTPYILLLWAPMIGVVVAGFLAYGFVVYRLIRRFLRRPLPFDHAHWVLSLLFLAAPVAWWILTLDFAFWSTVVYIAAASAGVIVGTRAAMSALTRPLSTPIV